jgi:hypothetical protein
MLRSSQSAERNDASAQANSTPTPKVSADCCVLYTKPTAARSGVRKVGPNTGVGQRPLVDAHAYLTHRAVRG